MSAAIQFAPRYTIDGYSLWQGDWELWEGIAIAMSQLYRRENVDVYLIVDPAGETVEVDRRHANGGYETFQADEELILRVCESCEITIPIWKLFHG